VATVMMRRFLGSFAKELCGSSMSKDFHGRNGLSVRVTSLQLSIRRDRSFLGISLVEWMAFLQEDEYVQRPRCGARKDAKA